MGITRTERVVRPVVVVTVDTPGDKDYEADFFAPLADSSARSSSASQL